MRRPRVTRLLGPVEPRRITSGCRRGPGDVVELTTTPTSTATTPADQTSDQHADQHQDHADHDHPEGTGSDEHAGHPDRVDAV